MAILKKRTIAIILAKVLLLSLMLTACGKSGDNPTGDNSTPGTSSTPGGTSDGSNTPKPTETPKYKMPPYDKEYKAFLDNNIASIGEIDGQRLDIDLDNTLDKIYEKYSQYLNVNISKDAVKIMIGNRTLSTYVHGMGKMAVLNITGISPDTITKANDFLVSKGEKPLGITDPDSLKTHNEMLAGIRMEPVSAILTPEENITAFWLAASLFYDPDLEILKEINIPCYDIAMALALTMVDPAKRETTGNALDDYMAGKDEGYKIAGEVWNYYLKLYGAFDDYDSFCDSVLNP